jgi:hypothetical protein
MSSIEVKSFDNPDESNTSFNNAKMDIVKVGDQRVMRLTFATRLEMVTRY